MLQVRHVEPSTLQLQIAIVLLLIFEQHILICSYVIKLDVSIIFSNKQQSMKIEELKCDL